MLTHCCSQARSRPLWAWRIGPRRSALPGQFRWHRIGDLVDDGAAVIANSVERPCRARQVHTAGRRRRGRFAALWYLVTTLLGLAVGFAFIATIGIWSSIAPSLGALADLSLGFWFVVAIAAWTLFNLQDGLLTGLGRATIVPIENTAYAVAKLIVLIALAGWAGGTAIVVSWTLPAAVVVFVVTVLIFALLVPIPAGKRGEEAASLDAAAYSIPGPRLCRVCPGDMHGNPAASDCPGSCRCF